MMISKKLFPLITILLCITAGAQEQFVRRSVVEEFTGTWCGNCPRGIVGMHRLAEDFGDRFIGIAIHTGSDEPMVIPAYPDVKDDRIPGSGVPCCIIDRSRFKFDPYSGSGEKGVFHYGIDADFAAALAMPTEAKVDLVAEWNDAYDWDVRFTVTTTFNIDRPTAPYRLILVLTEDGLTGTADNWRQVNYFSSDYDGTRDTENYSDDDMAFWRNTPYLVPGIVYDHVAVNTNGIRHGIENSIAAPVVAWQPQTYTGTVSILSSHAQRIIQDKSRLHAVAMLIATETGNVVNAAKADILPFGSSGISETRRQTVAAQTAYDLQGRPLTSYLSPLTSHKKGIYIVNGKKYIIK